VARYAVFIDGGCVRKALKQLGSPRISFLKLTERFQGNDDRLRTYYYDCAPYQSPTPTQEERARKAGFDKFHRAVDRLPRTQVRLGRLARHVAVDGLPWFEQKKVDILLAVDLMRLSFEKQIERGVIVATDSDFVPAIQAARDAGVVIEVCYFEGSRLHDELRDAADELIVLTKTDVEAMKQ